MNRLVRLTTGLTLALTALAAAPLESKTGDAPRALGTGPAYVTLGKLAVLHEGRVKPLDTFAREEVKQIFGRETIKLLDPTRDNKVVETWGPVAAAFDWSVRPTSGTTRPSFSLSTSP